MSRMPTGLLLAAALGSMASLGGGWGDAPGSHAPEPIPDESIDEKIARGYNLGFQSAPPKPKKLRRSKKAAKKARAKQWRAK